MSLDNLVGNSLEKITPEAASLAKLLEAAVRNIADAGVDTISTENRFDAAYKAIMQLANAVLQANGYRTLTSRPGHHMTMIQALPQTCQMERDQMIVLDGLRRQRNISDYSGDRVSEDAASECRRQAQLLYEHVLQWLNENKPELMD